MSELKITGKFHEKFPEKQATEKLKTRDFIIEVAGQYPSFPKFQAKNNVCDFLDAFNEGDEVEVSFNLNGRYYTKDGEQRHFTTVEAWKIQKVGASKPTTATAQLPPVQAQAPAPAGVGDDLPF